MMTHLSELQRANIITTFKQHGSINKTARLLSISRESVQRWVKRFELTRNIKPLPPKGRARLLGNNECAVAEQLLLSKDFGTLQSVANELFNRHKVRVHPSTLSRNVKRYCKANGKPIHAVSTKPAKQLSPDTMRKRLLFAKANLHRSTWNNVMFTDRCKFQHVYVGSVVKRSVWKRVGEQRVAPRVNHASCFNVYAGITRYGVTKLHIVAGTTKHTSKFSNKKGQPAKNITSQEYEEVVSKTLLPEGKRIFDAGPCLNSWVLQQDNDPTHKKASLRAIGDWNNQKKGNKVELLANWPPNSPDLNPIENVWAYVQAEVDQAGCKDFDSFCAKVKEVFANLDRKMLSNLFGSMRKRLQEVIAKDGGKTRY